MLARRVHALPRRAQPCPAHRVRARSTAAAPPPSSQHTYAKTLLLPSTKFSEFPTLADEQRILKHCNETLYQWNLKVCAVSVNVQCGAGRRSNRASRHSNPTADRSGCCTTDHRTPMVTRTLATRSTRY